MNTLIIGCGKLGIPLGLRLLQLNKTQKVVGLRRNTTLIPAPITPYSHDLEKSIPSQLLQEADCAYIILTPDQRNEEHYRKVYGEYIPRIAKALNNAHKPQRIILTSSSHVYSENKGEKVNENTETQGYDYRSESLIKAEEAILSLNVHSQKTAAVCRFSGLYDEGSTYLKTLSKKEVIPTPLHYMNRLHREDAVGFLFHLHQMPTLDPIYLASDSNPCTKKEALERFSSEALLFESQNEPSGKRCLNQKMRDTGYVLKYPDFVSVHTCMR